MTTVAKLKITLYNNDREVTDLTSCSSSDTAELERSIRVFLETMQMAGLTRDQRKEVSRLFGPDDVMNVSVDSDDTLEISARGKFTNALLDSKTGKKVAFSQPRPKLARDEDNYESDDDDETGEDCLSHITHIKIDKVSGGRRHKTRKHRRRRSTRRRATRKA